MVINQKTRTRKTRICFSIIYHIVTLQNLNGSRNAFYIYDCLWKLLTRNFSSDIFLLCITQLFLLQELCDTFYCPYHASMHKMIHSHTIPDENTQMFGGLVYSYLQIISFTFFEQQFNFLFNFIH